MFGTLLDGLLVPAVGVRNVFALIAAIACSGFLLVCALDETKTQRRELQWSRANPLGSLALLSRNGVAARLNLVSFLVLTGQAACVTLLPLYTLDVFQFSTAEIGNCLAIIFTTTSLGLIGLSTFINNLLRLKSVLMLSVFATFLCWSAAGLCQTETQFLVTMAFSWLNGLYFPVVRMTTAGCFGAGTIRISIMIPGLDSISNPGCSSNLQSAENFGAALGAVAFVQQTTNLIGPAGASKMYASVVGYTLPETGSGHHIAHHNRSNTSLLLLLGSGAASNETAVQEIEGTFGARAAFSYGPALCTMLPALLVAACLPQLESISEGNTPSKRIGWRRGGSLQGPLETPLFRD